MATEVHESARGHLVGGDRLLAVLRELARHPDGVRLDDLAKALNSPKSTIHRVLGTLHRSGFARQDGDSYYHLGFDFLRLAFEYHDGLNRQRLVHPVLASLAGRFTCAAHYAELEGREAVCIDKVAPQTGTIRITGIGSRNPAHCTAVGKAMLAWTLEDDVAVREWVAQHGPLVRRTERTIVEPGALATALRDVRRRGYALDDREGEEGVVCIAFPIFLGARRVPTGAISLTDLMARRSARDFQSIASEVEAVIESQLGLVTRPS